MDTWCPCSFLGERKTEILRFAQDDRGGRDEEDKDVERRDRVLSRSIMYCVAAGLIQRPHPIPLPGGEGVRVGMVEAAGVEPASGGVTGEATPCSASSWFSPRRLKKRQNSGGATPNWFRRSVRGSGPATPAFGVGVRNAAGALSGHRHCALITQRERDCCYWQLSFFTF